MFYAFKIGIFLPLFVFILGGISPSVSLAYDVCDLNSVSPIIPCDYQGTIMDSYGWKHEGDGSNLYNFYWQEENFTTTWNYDSNQHTFYLLLEYISGYPGIVTISNSDGNGGFNEPFYGPTTFTWGNLSYLKDEGYTPEIFSDIYMPIECNGYCQYGLEAWSLSVVFPELDGNNHADVIPSTNFYVKIGYTVPQNTNPDEVRFSYTSCDSDFSSGDCVNQDHVLSAGTGSLTTAAGVGDGFIYVSTPVTLGNSAYLHLVFSNMDATEVYGESVYFDLTGSYASGLPEGDGALYPSYSNVPSILEDPSGFVAAFLDNLYNWVVRLIVPNVLFFQSQYSLINTLIHEKFSFYFQIKDAIIVSQTGSYSGAYLGSISFPGGSATAPVLFFGNLNADDFVGFRSFLSMILYVSLAFFLLRRVSYIFSS